MAARRMSAGDLTQDARGLCRRAALCSSKGGKGRACEQSHFKSSCADKQLLYCHYLQTNGTSLASINICTAIQNAHLAGVLAILFGKRARISRIGRKGRPYKTSGLLDFHRVSGSSVIQA